MRAQRAVDPFGLAGAAVAALSAGLYVSIMVGQGATPTVWVVASLVIAAGLVAYGAVVAAPHRRIALAVSTGVLGLLGLIAILTIGLVIEVAAVLALVATMRAVAVGQPTRGYRPSR